MDLTSSLVSKYFAGVTETLSQYEGARPLHVVCQNVNQRSYVNKQDELPGCYLIISLVDNASQV